MPLLEQVIWDGILGLGFQSEKLSKYGILPVMDNIMQSEILTKKK